MKELAEPSKDQSSPHRKSKSEEKNPANADTFACLYCGLDKPKSEASLEHAIPQFMGGEAAPSQYMLRNVCGTCNNRLGLFVDAAYAKSWFVTNDLSTAAWRLYTGLADPPLPLVCLGLSKITGLVQDDEQVAENWLGPSGETITWLRANDERLHGYAGGNPIDKKQKPSIAYLCLTSQDATRWQMGIASFLQAFKSKNIRKILCARVVDASGNDLLPGFDARIADDEANVGVIMNALKSRSLGGRIGVKADFDRRFIAKMALGVGYSLFGSPYLDTEMAKEARKTCWPRDGESGQTRGSTIFTSPQDPLLSRFIGYPGAVVVAVMNIGTSYGLSVTVDQAIPFTVELAPSTLSSRFVDREQGYVLVLFPSLSKAVETTLAELIAHSTGVQMHPALEEIDTRFTLAADFRRRLGPVELVDASDTATGSPE